MGEYTALTEQIADQIMKVRGYNRTAVAREGKENATFFYMKTVEGLDTILQAEVELKAQRMKLNFSELKYFCTLTTGFFDFHHKDFDRIEQVMYTYAAKCTEQDVFEILNVWSYNVMKEEREEKKPKKTMKELKREFWDKIKEYGKSKDYSQQMCLDFYNYWGEVNSKGDKMRWQIAMKKGGTFDLHGRMRTWASRENEYKPGFKKKIDTAIQKQNDETKSKKINTNDLF